MIVGGNLLMLALGAVGAQPVQWAKFLDRTTNAAGQREPRYADPVTIQGNLQPMAKRLYQSLGLDWTKTYVVFYTPEDVISVDRDGCGDKLLHLGSVYVCESSTDWQMQDGWVQITAVKVPA